MDIATGKALHFDGFSIDVMRCALLRGAEEIPLRPKAFDVLRFLAEHAGRVVAKDELIKAVWPGLSVTDDSLVQCVKEIREALGDDAHRIIRTVPRRGYLFASTISIAPPAREAAASIGAGHLWRPRRRIRASRHWRLGLAAAVLLLLGAGPGGWVLRGRSGMPAVTGPSRQDANARIRPFTRSIAVLPFTRLSNDSSQDYLVD